MVRIFITSTVSRRSKIFGSVRVCVCVSVCQGQGQMSKIVFRHHYYLGLRSRSKVRVKVKVKGRGQCHGSRSNFWCAAVDIRGLGLPSAAEGQGVYTDNSSDVVDRLLITFRIRGRGNIFGSIRLSVCACLCSAD